MGAFGYLLYLAFIFLPGIGLGELLSLWRAQSSLAERLAISFGLGLAVDTLLLMIRTSGIRVGGYSLVGLDLSYVYFILAFGLAAILVPLAVRRRFTFPVKPTKADLIILLAVIVQGSILLLYFAKYPIFPEYQSQDFMAHVTIAQGLISGTPSIPTGLLYFGVHFQLASAILLVGGVPLITVERTMSILVLLSVLIVYLASVRIFSSRRAGLIAATVYVLSGTIWFGSVYNSGLYANFFGIIAALFLIVSVLNVQDNFGQVSAWTVLALAMVLAYFSHYTIVTLFPSLLVLPLLQFVYKRSELKRYLIPALVVLLPAGIGALLVPALDVELLQAATEGGGVVNGGTFLSGLLRGVPVLSYMAAEVTFDLGFALTAALCAIFVWRSYSERNPILLLPLLWFISILIASPFNVGAWRFAYEALIPFVLMASYALFTLLPKIEAGKKGRKPSPTLYWKTGFILLLVLIPLLAGSWGVMAVSDALTSTNVSSQSQSYVNASIYWLRANTPQNSTYLSVSDWRFLYTSSLIGRQTTYTFADDPAAASELAKQAGIAYIIVTYVVTVSLPPESSAFPWNTFPSGSTDNLTLIYTNPDVRIYKLSR